MRAAVCREFGKPLVIEELRLDPVGPDDVQVDVAACSICHSDIHYAEGSWGGELPAVYGHEAAGTVSAVGRGVRSVAIWDRVSVSLIRSCGTCRQCLRSNEVFCQTDLGPVPARLHRSDGTTVDAGLRCGAFAEQVVVHHSQVMPIPASIGWNAAALLGCGVVTGVGAVLNTSSVDNASIVAVIGAGGVGLNAIQGARLAGAAAIIAIDIVDHKLEVARRFGATASVNANGDVRAGVAAATEGAGLTHAFVTVGSTVAVELAIDLVAAGSEVVIVGMPPVGARLEIDPTEIADKGLHIVGSKMGDTRLGVDIARLLNWYEQGTLMLDELVSATYPLESINEAIHDVTTGNALRNVITMP